MPQNGLDVELQRTLSELCEDLFAVTALDECNAILKSLVQLAETFPQAQAHIGRHLAQNEDTQVYPANRRSKMAALSVKFLYKKETACSAVFLMAALANHSEHNQRLIAASVVGVKLVGIDLTKCYKRQSRSSTAISLYALTVPAIVTSTFRRWRERQRDLQHCRLPSGDPPADDGIPMPCYCDDCLGAEQFLSTWQHHFQDLSRWSREPNEGACANDNAPSLSTEDFFRVYLADYQMHVCTVDEGLSNRTSSEFKRAGRTSEHCSLLYYFVSPEDATAATPRTPPQFNPLFHLSAIAIKAEIDTARANDVRLETYEESRVRTESLVFEPVNSDMLASEQVILFNEIADIESCAIPSIEASDSNFDVSSNPSALSARRLVEDLIRLERQHGQIVQCGLLIALTGEEREFSSITRQLLFYLLLFCNNEDHVPLYAFRRALCGSIRPDQQHEEFGTLRRNDSTNTATLNSNCRIIMTANLSEQVLRIDCIPSRTPTTTSVGLFSVRVSQQELTGMNSLADQRSFGLLRLSDEALVKLTQLCRICQCNNQKAHSDPKIYLRSMDDEVISGQDIDVGDDNFTVQSSSTLTRGGAIRLPLPGLSFKAQRGLIKLKETAVATGEDITATTEKLTKIIADCNDRVFYLTLARDQELVRVAPEVHRAAAIARCQYCRDLLIQLGKRIALQMKSFDKSTPMSQEKLSRLINLLRTSIGGVLTHSDSFDPWETPDERVGKLQLDQRVWASGFPDAAYFRDTAMRQCTNRKKQQQLSRKLQKKSKDQTQEKQRKRYLEQNSR